MAIPLYRTATVYSRNRRHIQCRLFIHRSKVAYSIREAT